MSKQIKVDIPKELSVAYNSYTKETIKNLMPNLEKIDLSKCKMNLIEMIDAKNESDIEALVPISNKFFLSVLKRFFYLRNVISDTKIVDFGLKDAEYSQKISEIAQIFHSQPILNKHSYVMHIKYVAFSQMSALYACFLSVGVLPDDFTIDNFVRAGKGTLQ